MRARQPGFALLWLAGCAGANPAGLGDAGADAEDVTATADVLADAGLALSDAGADADEPTGCSGICNAVTPSNPQVGTRGGSGNITMYTTLPSSGGACNYGTTGIAYFAAVNVNIEPGDGKGQWQGGRICGQCAEISAYTSRGNPSVVVRIMDRCADAACGMDLGGLAPAAIMLDGFGRYDGAWRFVSCAGHPEVSDGSPTLYVGAGSNAWWSRVQVRNPPWAVADVTWRASDGATGVFPYAADPENSFEVPAAVLQSSATAVVVTVHYGDGTTAAVEVAPGQLAAPETGYPLE